MNHDTLKNTQNSLSIFKQVDLLLKGLDKALAGTQEPQLIELQKSGKIIEHLLEKHIEETQKMCDDAKTAPVIKP